MPIKDTKSAKYTALLRDSYSAITVGVHSEDGDREEGPTNVDIATAHVLGLGVPKRDFIRPWVDRHATEHKRMIQNEFAKARIAGRPPATAGRRVALVMEGNMKAEFAILPELSDATKRRKGSSTPLVDTGVLRASVRGKYEAS